MLFCQAGSKGWEEFGAVVDCIGFEDAIDGMEHFAGHGSECLKFGFASCQQLEIEGLQMRIEARRGECWHIQGLAQRAIALPADTRGFVHRSARSPMCRIEPAVSDPLTHRHLFIHACQFGQDLHPAQFADARYDQQAQPFAMSLGVAFDPDPRLAAQL